MVSISGNSPSGPEEARHADLLGRHYLADFTGCPVELIARVDSLETMFLEVLGRQGATILGHRAHQFEPAGATVVVLLAESHASLHTWPEKGAVCVDFFTCSDALQATAALEDIAGFLGAARSNIRIVEREVPADA